MGDAKTLKTTTRLIFFCTKKVPKFRSRNFESCNGLVGALLPALSGPAETGRVAADLVVAAADTTSLTATWTAHSVAGRADVQEQAIKKQKEI